jgi:hypothetical protein
MSEFDIEFDESEIEPTEYHTQGGGTVEWCDAAKWWVFIKPPPGFDVGQVMPPEWSIV